MEMLDQTRTEPRRSEAWTGMLVKQRLLDACDVERRLPGERFYKIVSTWPATPIYEFTDMLHWDDARQRVWDRWEHAKGAYPHEVSMMWEAFAWLEWLPIEDRRFLAAWAQASSRGYSVRSLLRKQGLKRNTFYTKIKQAACKIADRLNRQGVMVR